MFAPQFSLNIYNIEMKISLNLKAKDDIFMTLK